MAFSREGTNVEVVPGEDQESDEDETISQLLYQRGNYQPSQIPSSVSQGIVVCGEASESDEEIGPGTPSGSQTSGSDFSFADGRRYFSKQSTDASETSSRFEERLKYNTLLHRKLRERNLNMHRNLVELACQPYQSASKEIHSISQQLVKSQQLVQDVSSTLRRLTNELFTLEDKVHTLRSCNFFPDIDIDSLPTEDSP